jgi:nitric oxide reductase NorD protein
VPSDDASTDGPQPLSMLASALSGHTLRVAPAGPGQPAWTDGRTVFVDAGASARERLQAITVQASLVAAGSLAPDLMRRLRRRPGRTARYLAVEGHRALAANEDLLPPSVRSLVDRDVAARSASSEASLAAARSGQPIADPPESFGVIRPGKLLETSRNDAGAAQSTGRHIARRQPSKPLAELDEHDNDEDADEVADVFTSPVGGGGALGRLFQKMLGVVRKLGEGGQPGADTPTHRTSSAPRGGANAVVSTSVDTANGDDAMQRGGTKYPEWDVHQRRYRPDWCTVQEVEPRLADASLDASGADGLRRPLARLGLGLDRYHRQAQGDDIDIDAAVEARVEVMAGSAPDEAVYLDSLRRRRDLSVLLLLDISGSVAEPGAMGRTVHEQQRAAAAALTVALHDLGDRVALYAFHSQGRSAVSVIPVKRFDGNPDALVMRRLGSLVPGAYSRLGAAIRHGAAVLQARGGTPRRLLVVLSDGLAYDHGYDRRYGAADARRALAEARRSGIGCLCLTIGAATDVAELRRVFGTAAHATIPRLDELSRVIGPLFRSALVSAEARQRVAQAKSRPPNALQ